MLSHSELRRAARILEERCVNFRVDKVIEAREHRVQLTLYGRSGDDATSSKNHVLLCCAPGTGRVSELSRSEKSPEDLLKFAQYLRPRITGSSGDAKSDSKTETSSDSKAGPSKSESKPAANSGGSDSASGSSKPSSGASQGSD